MSDPLEEHDGKISTGGRNMSNGTDSLTEEKQELEAHVWILDQSCIRYNLKISAETDEN